MKEWNEFLAELEQELGSERVQKWIPKLTRFDAANIYLETEDSFQASWFEEHVRPKLKGFANANHRPIKVHLNNTDKKNKEKKEAPPLSFDPDRLDPEMTFDHFIPSEKNQIVYQLLQDPVSFNPIFLFGAKGVGKTHLLQAAAHHLQKMGKRVFFIRAETFTDHVVQAIRLGQMQSFRKAYRDMDALIIDDIHIFSKKSATQEEFFHTFNTLHTQGKPILISAPVPPAQLPEMEPRLISRFEWGLSLEVGATQQTTLLRKKAQMWNIALSEELISFLAQKFPHEATAALQVLLLRSKTDVLNIPLAEHHLKDWLARHSENALTFEKIVKKVAAHYGITTEDILGKSQMRSMALPRQIAMYYCREKLRLPLQKIGTLFHRDHSTVMSSLKQVQKALDEKSLSLPEVD
ncbi:MAG: ATP-binding protein [Verrucomicrobia bacterium]|nr:ATP-binding protein [Verrucomicrobiota bacterium]MDE3047324.1 ATP-binding protein [Verrucomicrobiota bacterium]